MNIDIFNLEIFVAKKKFNTRGLPFSKKMWRDGYNKALDDFLTFVKMNYELPSDQPAGIHTTGNGKPNKPMDEQGGDNVTT